MAEQIRDGEGSGRLAGVDKNHRLKTNAQSNFAEEIAAQNERAYILHGECHLSASANGGFLAVRNDSTDVLLAISRIYIDPHLLSGDLIIYQVKNPTISNGTDISETGIVNKNYTSRRRMIGTLWISDGSSDLTYTDGSNYHAFSAQSLTSKQRDMKGTNIIGQNDVLLFGWKTADGSNAVDGEIVSFSVNLYEVPVEEIG